MCGVVMHWYTLESQVRKSWVRVLARKEGSFYLFLQSTPVLNAVPYVVSMLE